MREPGEDDVIDLDAEREAREKARTEKELAEAKAHLARVRYREAVLRVAEDLKPVFGTEEEIDEPAKWTTVDQLLQEEFPAADWLIKGLVPKDTLTIIAGDPKASKTWTLLELAFALASGEKVFGEFDVAEPAGESVILFLNEDTRRSVRNRFRALAAARDVSLERLSKIAVRAREALDLGSRISVAKFIVDVLAAPVRPALIGLDPLRNLHAMEENSSTEMRQVLRALGAIREHCGCALAVVHHSAKRGRDGVDNRTGGQLMRGSSAIDGYRDGLISLEKTRKPSAEEICNEVVVDLKAYRGAGIFNLTLRIEDDEQREAKRAWWEHSATEQDQAGAEDPDQREGRVEVVAKKTLDWFRSRHELLAGTSKQEFIVRKGAAVRELADLLTAGTPTVRKAIEWLVEADKLIEEPVPSRDQRNRGKGVEPRFQLRLHPDAVTPPEDDP